MNETIVVTVHSQTDAFRAVLIVDLDMTVTPIDSKLKGPIAYGQLIEIVERRVVAEGAPGSARPLRSSRTGRSSGSHQALRSSRPLRSPWSGRTSRTLKTPRPLRPGRPPRPHRPLRSPRTRRPLNPRRAPLPRPDGLELVQLLVDATDRFVDALGEYGRRPDSDCKQHQNEAAHLRISSIRCTHYSSRLGNRCQRRTGCGVSRFPVQWSWFRVVLTTAYLRRRRHHRPARTERG